MSAIGNLLHNPHFLTTIFFLIKNITNLFKSTCQLHRTFHRWNLTIYLNSNTLQQIFLLMCLLSFWKICKFFQFFTQLEIFPSYFLSWYKYIFTVLCVCLMLCKRGQCYLCWYQCCLQTINFTSLIFMFYILIFF